MSSIELWVASWFLDVSIKAALLAVAAWMGMAACCVRSSTVRHRVWFLVLVGILLLPALVNIAPSVSLPGWLYPTLQLAAVRGEMDGGMPSTSLQEPAVDERNVPAPSGPRSALPLREPGPATPARDAATHAIAGQEPREAVAIPLPVLPAKAVPSVAPRAAGSSRFALAFIGAYLAGVVLLIVRLLIGTLQAGRLVRRARQVDVPWNAAWLPTGARIVESDAVRVPVTIGYRRPRVVLPVDWKPWSDSSLAMVLTHETEHVRRRDTWIALLAALNCAVYWFHPVAWFVRRRLTDLAEQICDDAVIRVTGSRNEYAQNLLDMAGRLAAGCGRLRPVGVAMARKANVVKRIEAILDNDRPLSRKIGAVGALLLFCIVAPLVFLAAGLRPTAPTVAAEAAATTVKSEKTVESKPSPTSLKGRVLMAGDGKPVAGAEVWLLIWKPKGLVRRTATTNREGQFEFKELTAGRYTLAAYYQNLSSRTKQYKGYEAKAGEDSIVLELREAPSLKVKVVARADGKPIGGAAVWLRWADAKRDHLTGANGEVVIYGLTSEIWTIEARAKGFAEDVQAVNLNATDTSSVTAKLVPGVELFGVVRDEAGKGLPGAGISVFPSGLSGQQTEYMSTDADGRYRFEYLPIAGLTLLLSKEGYTDVRHDVAITAPPRGRQELNLILPRRPDGGSVRGTVVDKDGKPVEGASVVNRGLASRDLRRTTTDAQGRYRLDDVYKASNSHDLFIKAKRFAPQQLEFEPGDRNRPAELNVNLAAGHRIRGRVVNEQGEALAGVQVYYAHGNRVPGYDFGGKTATDVEGHFEFDSLPAESPFAFQKGGYSGMEDVTLPLDGQKEVMVTMRSAGAIRGRVVDGGTGKPLSPFTVRVTFSPDRKPGEPSSGLSGARVFGGEKFTTRDGTFRMGDFTRGMPLQVMVEADGYDRAVVRRVVAVANSDAEPLEFRLARIDASSLLTIVGRLVDEQAKPVAGAELRLIVASQRPFPRDRFPFNWQMIRVGHVESSDLVLQFLAAVTDREGRFSFKKVRSGGDIELVYWGEGVSQNRREHIEQLSPKEQSNLTVTSKAPGIVRGAIDRKAYAEFSDIMLSGGNDFHNAKLPSRNNSYEIRNVPEGRYELQVLGPNRPSGRGQGTFARDVIKRIPVTVKSGETLIADLGSDSSGVYQPAKGGDSAPEKPRLLDRGSPSKRSSRDGQTGLTEGAAARDASTGDKGSEIVIAGTVRDESGAAVGGAKLWLPLKHDDDKRLAEATTTEAGAFTLHVPAAWTEPGAFTPPGTIWCYARDRRIAAASAYQQLKRRSHSPIEIVLKPKVDTGFIVKDFGGSSIAGARVEPLHFFVGHYDIIPRQLREIIAKKTDDGGRVFFPEMGRDGFFSVQVTAKGYGIQELRLRDLATEPAIRTITLRPTGRLEGRLVSDDKTAIKSARVYVYQENFGGEHTSGTASPNVNEDGRFVVPAFAEGAIKLIITVDRSLTLRPRIPQNLEIYAGRTTHVEVPFERTVHVRGRVQTKGNGVPIAGARVSVQYGSFQQNDNVLTDADGRFDTNVLAGPVRRQLIIRPDEYSDWIVEEADWQTVINVPAGLETFNLPPLLLIETSERAGRLVDRKNRPVAEADIRAIIGNRVCARGKTDKSGAFTLRLPKSFKIEKYDVSRSQEAGPIAANVIGETPLVLQVLD
ncbi:MAG: carboxypeptidase regulatory-like domain-containing protein [Thermoguttaceae bacterium]